MTAPTSSIFGHDVGLAHRGAPCRSTPWRRSQRLIHRHRRAQVDDHRTGIALENVVAATTGPSVMFLAERDPALVDQREPVDVRVDGQSQIGPGMDRTSAASSSRCSARGSGSRGNMFPS